jgi:hypothetical protein
MVSDAFYIMILLQNQFTTIPKMVSDTFFGSAFFGSAFRIISSSDLT